MTINTTESNTGFQPESTASLALPVDLHIKANSAAEAEEIAGLLANFERTQDVAVGTGIAKDTFRVRGTFKLNGPLDPKLLVEMQAVDEMSATQNQFLDAGWEPIGKSHGLALTFSHAPMPVRKVEKSIESPSQTAFNQAIQKIKAWFVTRQGIQPARRREE